MTQVAYGSGFSKKEFACVEVASLYNQTGAYVPSGPLSIQGIFTNTLGETIATTITVVAGGSVVSGGLTFSLGGASTNYLVTISFNRKYSGSIQLIGTSIDNSLIGGTDKFCNASIGNPDIIPIDGELIGNCFQAALTSNPVTPKTFGWSEVNELTSFTFSFQRNNIGSSVTLSLILTEKSLQKWQKNNDVTPPVYTDPLTSTIYTTLPAGVFEVNCEESNEVVSYSKELCYKISSPISFDLSGVSAEPWDAYNRIRPRTDGIPFLTYSPFPFSFAEFNNKGTSLYSISGGTLFTNTYSGFTQTGFIPTALNFLGFAAAAGYTPVGITIHPTTNTIYVMYIDGSRNLFLATIINSVVNLVGNCQFVSAVTAPIDAHDITFTSSGQLLMAHGNKLYLVDSTNGVINPTFIQLVGTSTNEFSIRSITRYYNGDLHLAGQDVSLGFIVIILDGEGYTKISDWASDNSTTSPDSTISIAYPVNSELKFNRLYTKNVETNQLSIDDRDLVTGLPITIPQNAIISDCSSIIPKEVSWVEDACYVVDQNVISQGLVQISGGQIVSTAACALVAGFIPPAPVTHSSFTHNKSLNSLIALNAGVPSLQFYNWTVINAPAVGAVLPLIGVAGTIKSVRTRWKDDSLWIMAEQTVGAFRNYSFYIVNLTTGNCVLQGVANYSAGEKNNGHFTIGIDDNFYFSYSLGGSNYRVSKISKTNFGLQSTVFDTNYVIDNINTDLVNQGLIVTKSVTPGIDFFSYSGTLISNCSGAIYADAIYAPFGILNIGDSVTKVKKIFIKDLNTGTVSTYYHDIVTGQDITLPSLARFVKCDAAIESANQSFPRMQIVTGINSWNKSLVAPNAKSITVTRLANQITITDGMFATTVNAAFSATWTADNMGNGLIISGNAAGSSFLVHWI